MSRRFYKQKPAIGPTFVLRSAVEFEIIRCLFPLLESPAWRAPHAAIALARFGNPGHCTPTPIGRCISELVEGGKIVNVVAY